MTEIPILLLTGYLGSGKTTLLNRILTNERGLHFAVIVNDIGEVNIDASLIQKGGIVDTKDESLVALQNGCICCTLQADLMKQIDDILEMKRFDYIVIEASGICEPAPIAQTICMMNGMEGPAEVRPRLDCICTVTDALRLRDEFGCGEKLRRDDIEEEDVENLIIQQIEFCNLVLINKASEVTADEMKQIHTVIRTIQPQARIIECDYCDVPLTDLLNTHLFDFEKVATSAAWVRELEHIDDIDEDEHEHEHHHEHGHEHHHHHHDEGEAEEYGISTFVYFRRRPFDLCRFDRFVSIDWPQSVIRAKGVCYFEQTPDMSYLFEQAGRQKKLSEAGKWYATAPEEELRQIMLMEPGLERDWDPEYGDRMQKIVFIGRDMDREAIESALDSCLVEK